MLPKVRALRALLDKQDLDAHIEVDGGIDATTIADVSRAGANAFVAGTAVFGASNYKDAIAALRKTASV